MVRDGGYLGQEVERKMFLRTFHLLEFKFFVFGYKYWWQGFGYQLVVDLNRLVSQLLRTWQVW